MSFCPIVFPDTMTFMETLVDFLIFCSIFSCTWGHVEELHGQHTRQTNYRLKQALVSVEDIVHQLSSLSKATETCNAQLVNVTESLNSACKKIKQLGTSEVSLVKKDIYERTIRVDVNGEYGACVDRMKGYYTELYTGGIWCLRVPLWRNNHYDSTTDDLAEDALFGANLNSADQEVLQRGKQGTRQLKRIAPKDITVPRTGYRIRKEYRALTDDERQRYHSAVRELYKDGTFSCFARVHRKGIKLKGVHRGEAFLPWHRAFLALYEEALRQIDPNVSLPYWDSTIDFNMAAPSLSVMWDKDHLGTGFNNVTDGPFANFTTDDNPLKRHIGTGNGSLMKPNTIKNILQNGFCRLGDIFKRLESAHNSVHRWVGGTMARSLSASDPVFYMHHAFIDYIWEEFRTIQKSEACNEIDPGTDYPVFNESSPKPTKPEHLPDEKMDGMEFLKNRQGVENFWTTNWYGYAERPSCANNCSNSVDMKCDNVMNRCVGVMEDDPGDDPLPPGRRKRQVPFAESLSSQLYASIKMTSSFEGDNYSICRTQPYSRSCPTPAPPTTIEEIASAIVNKELPMSDRISKIYKKILKNRDRIFETPPESEPVFFRETGDVGNDCRTIDTAIYDLIIEMLSGRKVVGKHT